MVSEFRPVLVQPVTGLPRLPLKESAGTAVTVYWYSGLPLASSGRATTLTPCMPDAGAESDCSLDGDGAGGRDLLAGEGGCVRWGDRVKAIEGGDVVIVEVVGVGNAGAPAAPQTPLSGSMMGHANMASVGCRKSYRG